MAVTAAPKPKLNQHSIAEIGFEFSTPAIDTRETAHDASFDGLTRPQAA